MDRSSTTTADMTTATTAARTAAPAAALAAAAAAAMAAVLLARPGTSAPDFSEPVQYLQDGVFLLYLVAAGAALLGAARTGLVAAVPARLVAVGYGLIAVGVAAGLVLRDDPEWFVVLGAPGNLLAGIGFVALAVIAVRRRTLPVPMAVLGGVGGFFAVLFAEFGTSLLVTAFFVLLARRAGHRAAPRREPAAV